MNTAPITAEAAIARLREIFDGTLVKTGSDAGKRSGMHVTSVLEAVAILDAVLSSPPADDVREALAAIVKQVSQKFGGPSLAEFAKDPPTRKHYATADAIRSAFEVRPYGTVTDTEAFDRVRSYWRLIRGAQMDMLNGRPDMSAMEEIALASAGMDDLLMTSDAPEARS